MSKTTLVIRHLDNSFEVNVSDTDKQNNLLYLIDWIKLTNHGTVLSVSSPYTIDCKSEKDFIACRKKAKALKLISITTKETLQKRYVHKN